MLDDKMKDKNKYSATTKGKFLKIYINDIIVLNRMGQRYLKPQNY